MADREHYANLQPVFSCGLVLIKLEMPLTLPLEFTKTVRKRPLLERLSPASSWSIPMIDADFLHFTSKSVQIWPYLLYTSFFKQKMHKR